MFADIVKRLPIFLQTADEQRAFESSDDELGEFLWMNRGIDLMSRDAFADDFGYTAGPGLQGFFRAGAEDGVAVAGLYGGVHQRAATGDQAGAEFHKVSDHFFQAIDRVGGVIDTVKPFAGGL